ncbi:uncharacterized protein A4U43_C04F20280 [Asparagus officinalis]|uniref:Cyclin-dependent kinases regulatory subunit n=1 Tax=Asparagus officinalis TaxID=4686 RepID=A0A5P1F787_ASPOF|nr:uncharacterized protein A4U43_C04F20280 [Asparagus officinalis]
MGQIQYSEKYFDDTYEYRHVVLPPDVTKMLPKNRLLSENEWRAIRAEGGYTTRSTARSFTSCSSVGLSTTSSTRRLRPR